MVRMPVSLVKGHGRRLLILFFVTVTQTPGFCSRVAGGVPS